MKIGTDIVKIPRIEKAVQCEAFMKKVFTDSEIKYCKRTENFAGLYAAKEAYLKAIGCGIDRALCDVEIRHDEKGKPYISDTDNCDLSISHDGEYAIATVIIW